MCAIAYESMLRCDMRVSRARARRSICMASRVRVDPHAHLAPLRFAILPPIAPSRCQRPAALRRFAAGATVFGGILDFAFGFAWTVAFASATEVRCFKT